MSFSSDLERFAQKFNATANDFVQAVEIDLYSAVIQDTPVDTGRARGNWQATTGAPASGETEGQDSLAAMRSFVSSLRGGRVSFLTNNLPYIERLEYGSSQQAPAGMVRKNAARMQRIVNEQARKHRL